MLSLGQTRLVEQKGYHGKEGCKYCQTIPKTPNVLYTVFPENNAREKISKSKAQAAHKNEDKD